MYFPRGNKVRLCSEFAHNSFVLMIFGIWKPWKDALIMKWEAIMEVLVIGVLGEHFKLKYG